MKQKTLTIIFGMILLIGVGLVAGTIPDSSSSGDSGGGGSSIVINSASSGGGGGSNINPLILDIPGFIAGGTTSTEFSFDYPYVEVNYNNAPLVAKINVVSLDEDYPVWKGDFQFSMVAEQYLFGGLLGDLIHYNTIPMQCKENAPVQFKAKDKPDVQYSINEVPNGTFYCYNPNYYMMQLDSHDDITLSITSDPALYPGEYNISVELMEMEPDNSPPEIEFMIKGYVFAEIIPIKFNVTDMYTIQTVQYKITNPLLSEDNYFNSGWITTTFNEDSGLYEDYFNTEQYGLSGSGMYWIRAYACDVLGNCREM